MIKAEPIVKTDAMLGEGPTWHQVHQMLYWVDIEKKILHAFEPETSHRREWPVPKRLGTVSPASNGKLILGLQGQIAFFDVASGEIESLVAVEPDVQGNRCNDGKCDPIGRFWVGTMQLQCEPAAGSLYCLDTNLQLHKVLSGLTIANGMEWSPDGSYMYFIDSATYCVKRYRCDCEDVSLAEGEIILRFEADGGMPDGMCADSEGMLWIAFWGGGRVGRYNPVTGHHLADVVVPAPHVTSCCFGGRDLTTLYITTARDGLDQKQLAQYPLSGSLFACNADARGRQPGFFGMPAQ